MLNLIWFLCDLFFRTFLCFTANIISVNLFLRSLILRQRMIMIYFLGFLYLRVIICFMCLRKYNLFSYVWCLYKTTRIIAWQLNISIWNWCKDHNKILATGNLINIVIFKHTRIDSIRSTFIFIITISKYEMLSKSPRIYFISLSYNSITVLSISRYLWYLFLNLFRNISFF